jgi:hypothetical protein
MIAVVVEIGENLLRFALEVLVLVTMWVQLRRSRELRPNGGNSMRDAVHETRALINQIHQKYVVGLTDDQPHDKEA